MTYKAMFKMTDDQEEPPSRPASNSSQDIQGISTDISVKNNGQSAHIDRGGLIQWIKSNFKHKPDSTLREAIEEYIVESNGDIENEESSTSYHEKTLISNVLKLRDTPAVDAAIPRADIVAIDINADQKDLFELLASTQYSRIPVYREKLDDVLGTIHIKDILATLAKGKKVVIPDLVRDVPIVAPSMNILDLLLEMRHTRKHMAMVVDEFGGIDGLVTIGDIIEEIVGHLEDEHDIELQPQIISNDDGSIIADARLDIDEFEEEFGEMLSEEEREENDTLGGLAFYMAGRVPVRGEVLTHSTGMVFEILDADPRRVNRLRISHLPENIDQND